MKLSEPQELLLKKLKDGAELRHHIDTGLFRLKDAITELRCRTNLYPMA